MAPRCPLLLLLLLVLPAATVVAHYSSWYEVAQGRSHGVISPRNPITIEDMMSGIKFRRAAEVETPLDEVSKRFHLKYMRGLNRQPEIFRRRLFGE